MLPKKSKRVIEMYKSAFVLDLLLGNVKYRHAQDPFWNPSPQTLLNEIMENEMPLLSGGEGIWAPLGSGGFLRPAVLDCGCFSEGQKSYFKLPYRNWKFLSSHSDACCGWPAPLASRGSMPWG